MQRERRGWLGDAQLSAETTMMNFDMPAFYTKFLTDIRDSQRLYSPTNNGSLPDCVPFYNHGGLPADPAWSAAYPLITDWLADYAADDRIVATHYDGVKSFMDSQVRCRRSAHRVSGGGQSYAMRRFVVRVDVWGDERRRVE